MAKVTSMINKSTMAWTCIIIVMMILNPSLSFGKLLKQINHTDSYDYGDWRYDTIEFTDSVTILAGLYTAKTESWISSSRDEYIEISGRKYYVIENDLPYGKYGERIFSSGDTCRFTYIFPAVRNTLGLHNLKYEEFTIPVFFPKDSVSKLSEKELGQIYINSAIRSYNDSAIFKSLRYMEEYMRLSSDTATVSSFLRSHKIITEYNYVQLISNLKIAQIYSALGELENYEEALMSIYNERDIDEEFSKSGNLEILYNIILSNQRASLSDTFKMFVVRTMIHFKEYSAARDLLQEIVMDDCNGFTFKTEYLSYATFLNSLDVDSNRKFEVLNEIIENHPESKERILSYLFERYSDLERYDTAAKYGEQLLQTITDEMLCQHIVHIYKLAECYVKLKQYDKALEYHRLFSKVSSSLEPSMIDEDILDMRLSNSVRFINLSDYPSAVVSTEHNKNLVLQVYGKDSEEYINNMFYGAIGYRNIGNWDKAEEYFKEAYSLYSLSDPYSTFAIQCQYYLGLLHLLRRQYDTAGSILEDALIAFKRNNNNRLKGKLLRLQIELSLTTKNYARMYEAMEELQKLLNDDPSIQDQTFLSTSQGDYFFNLSLYDESLKMYSQTERDLKDNNIDRSSDVYINCIASKLEVYNAIHHDKNSTLQYANELWYSLKGMILDSLKKLPKSERYKIVELYESKFELLQSSLIQLNNDEANSLLYDIVLFRKGLLLGSDIFFKNKLQELITEDSEGNNSEPFNEFELIQKLDVNGINLNGLSYCWRDIQNILGDYDIAIEFITDGSHDNNDCSRYYALIVTKNCDYPVLQSIGLTSKTDQIEQEHYTSVALYNMVWRPILHLFEKISNIYFSPAGLIHKIAIENIEDGSGVMIKEKYNIFRVSSTKNIISKPNNNAHATTNIVYGGLNYDYDVSSDVISPIKGPNLSSIYRSSLLRGGVRFLKGTEREANFIVQEMERYGLQSILYQGTDGTELSFRRLQNRSISILHLATHGFFISDENDNEIDYKFLDKALRTTFAVEDRSLLNSGLLFSGVNSTLVSNCNKYAENDGILTSKELSKLNLGSVDLVVLSACQTGLGEIKGDGVFGLQRGFKIAGANTLLMSLWPVDDDATELIMKNFYMDYLQNGSESQALLFAQHTLRNIPGFEAPEYWAAFILLDALN